MWKQALTTIPRLSKEEFSTLDIISKWLIVTRAAVLIITFLSSAIAGILAYKDGLFDFTTWMLVTIGLLLSHATNNMLNDYVDWTKGVDQQNYYRNKYGTHPMILMEQQEFFTYMIITGLSALSIGIYLCFLKGIIVVYLTIFGSFFLLFYTWPLKYIGLGEVAVFLVWGILMIGGGYYTISNRWDWNVVIASFPYSLGVTAVIFGKHIDKLDMDQQKKIHTLPVILGESLARTVMLGMIALQYIFTMYLYYNKFFGVWIMISMLALFSDVKNRLFESLQKPKPKEKPAELPDGVWPLWFVAHAFQHNRSFGSLFLLGLILDVIF